MVIGVCCVITGVRFVREIEEMYKNFDTGFDCDQGLLCPTTFCTYGRNDSQAGATGTLEFVHGCGG